MSNKIGRLANNRIEHLMHPVFGGDIVHEKQQPFAERRHWRLRLRKEVGGSNKALRLGSVDGRDQRVAGGKMAIESPGSDTGCSRNPIEAGTRSLFSERGLCCFEQTNAVAFGIDARPAYSNGLTFLGHAKSSRCILLRFIEAGS